MRSNAVAVRRDRHRLWCVPAGALLFAAGVLVGTALPKFGHPGQGDPAVPARRPVLSGGGDLGSSIRAASLPRSIQVASTTSEERRSVDTRPHGPSGRTVVQISESAEPASPLEALSAKDLVIARQYVDAYIKSAQDGQSLFVTVADSIMNRERQNGRVELEQFDQSIEKRPSEAFIWSDGVLEVWVNAPGQERRLETVQIEDPTELALLLILDDIRNMRKFRRTTREATLECFPQSERGILEEAALDGLKAWPLPGMDVLDL